jgi:hypothetical protein
MKFFDFFWQRIPEESGQGVPSYTQAGALLRLVQGFNPNPNCARISRTV